MKTRTKLKLFPSEGKIKINCFISYNDNHYIVNEIFDHYLLTTTNKRLKLDKCVLLKVFIIRKNVILGELAYINYVNLEFTLKENKYIINNNWKFREFKINSIFNTIKLDDEVKITTFSTELDLYGKECTIINIKNRIFTVKIDNRVYKLRRYNFKPINKKNKKEVYMYNGTV